MFFEVRRYKIKEVYDIDKLAKMLAGGQTWCLCNGFKFSHVWFLNDAGSEEGAQEYAAIIRLPNGTFIQVESITMSWCTVEQVKGYLLDCARYAYGLDTDYPIAKVVYPNFNHVVGDCRHCA